MRPRSLLNRSTVYGTRAKLGLIVPPTNTANEAEWNAMTPRGITVHAARMPLHVDTTSAAGKQALRDDVRRYASDLAQIGPDVIAYGCTAGSMTHPVSALPEYMSDVTRRRCITTAQAIIEALRALGARRVAVATPYHDALNDHEADFLKAHGIEPVSVRGLGYGANGIEEYRNIARITPDEVFEHARLADCPNADAVLLSCTDLATLGVIERLEAALGKPVTSSNQATFWLALRRAGIPDRFEFYGRLLRDH